MTLTKIIKGNPVGAATMSYYQTYPSMTSMAQSSSCFLQPCMSTQQRHQPGVQQLYHPNPCHRNTYIPRNSTREVHHLNRSYQVLNPSVTINTNTPVIAHRAIYYKHKIFVGSLARSTSPDDLACFFRKFGGVIEAKVILDKDGNSKGYGFVSFASEDTVKSILNQGAIYMENKRIAVASAIRKMKYDDHDF